MDMPFKCYIYRSVQGGVIGEFICDDIFERIVRVGGSCEPPKYCICDWNMDCTPLDTLLADACLIKDELEKYLDGGVGYGLHISGLKIYNTPRKLSEFKGLCKVESDCCACPYYNYSKMDCDGRTIKHPPKSWCYVEELP